MRNRAGALGYLTSGMEATLKEPALIKESKLDPALYDVVVIGTPVWSDSVSSPTRAYMSKNKEKLKKVAFFCTLEGSGGERTFGVMKNLCGKDPVAVLKITRRRVLDQEHLQEVEQFVGRIRQLA